MAEHERITDEAVLAVFDALENPSEPLATSEVSDALGCSRRTAYDHLVSLADQGLLETKQIGARARAWWRSRPSEQTDTDVDVPVGAFDLATLARYLSEECVELTCRSEWLAQPFLDWFDAPASVTVDGFVPLEAAHLEYWTIEGLSGDQVHELPERFPATKSVRLLKSEDDTHELEVRATERSLLTVVDEFDGTPVSASIANGVVEFVARFPIGTDLDAVLAVLRETVVPDVESISEELVYRPRLFTTLVEDRLTETQWRALQIAYFGGYYEIPRTSTGTVLADKMGITRQTFTYHRRRAERAVFETLFAAPGYDGSPDSNQ